MSRRLRFEDRYSAEIGDPDGIDVTQPSGQQIATRAYRLVYDSLPECRREILDVLTSVVNKTDPRLTPNEISQRLGNRNSSLDNNSTRSRLAEMVKMAMIRKDGTKVDPASNIVNTAYRAFRPGESVPRPLTRGTSKKELEHRLNTYLDAFDAFSIEHPRMAETFLRYIPGEEEEEAA